MKLCFECNAPAEEDHHVVPQVLGGTKTVPLCSKCHGLAHHAHESWEGRSRLTKLGLQKARERGVVLGRPKKWSDEDCKTVFEMKQQGSTISAISRRIKVSRATVLRILSEEINTCTT